MLDAVSVLKVSPCDSSPTKFLLVFDQVPADFRSVFAISICYESQFVARRKTGTLINLFVSFSWMLSKVQFEFPKCKFVPTSFVLITCH